MEKATLTKPRVLETEFTFQDAQRKVEQQREEKRLALRRILRKLEEERLRK